MPRRAPAVRQRAHYSKDLLERIVYQRLVLGLPTQEIARLLNINRRTVQRTLQTFDKIGDVCRPKPGRTGRKRILLGELREFILTTVEERPYIYLDELRDAIQQHFGVIVHLSTVWRALKLFGLSLKQSSG
ncbi:Homeodomain-like protein [Auricularia subglabra TFB-10046 SS5]|nr:Homeodomain-like protein [Auricularia subglabra TFB-10046 SS5]